MARVVAQQQPHRYLRVPAPQLRRVPAGGDPDRLSPSCRKDPVCHSLPSVCAHPFARGPARRGELQALRTFATAPEVAWSTRSKSKEQWTQSESSWLLAPHCPWLESAKSFFPVLARVTNRAFA